MKPCGKGSCKHGYYTTQPRLCRIWGTMRSRCKNPHRTKYKDYGGRGIRVCQEWDNSAAAFCEWALRNGYDDTLQLDRINNNEGYSPNNCRWVSPKENSRNRRDNVRLNVDGEQKSVAEICETIPISPYTIYWWVREKGPEYAEQRIALWNRRTGDSK